MTKTQRLEYILKALANDRRLALLVVLKKHKECSVNYLASAISLSVYTVSRHLSLLESADVVEVRHEGTYRLYRLAPSMPVIARSIIRSLK